MKKITDNEPYAVKGFSRFAHVYESYNMIQAEVAKELISMLDMKHYSTIIDIGCGRGAVIQNLREQGVTFEKFIAQDLSEEMLKLHPSGGNIIKICSSFDQSGDLDEYCEEGTLLTSSSALQWSKNLDATLSHLSRCAYKSHFAIFTSNTFKTLHETAGITSPIYSSEVLKSVIEKYYKANFLIRTYELEFNSTKEMFQYIQKSGVSGGERQLNYTQMKRVMVEYPLNYLEFEVLFVEAMPLY